MSTIENYVDEFINELQLTIESEPKGSIKINKNCFANGKYDLGIMLDLLKTEEIVLPTKSENIIKIDNGLRVEAITTLIINGLTLSNFELSFHLDRFESWRCNMSAKLNFNSISEFIETLTSFGYINGGRLAGITSILPAQPISLNLSFNSVYQTITISAPIPSFNYLKDNVGVDFILKDIELVLKKKINRDATLSLISTSDFAGKEIKTSISCPVDRFILPNVFIFRVLSPIEISVKDIVSFISHFKNPLPSIPTFELPEKLEKIEFKVKNFGIQFNPTRSGNKVGYISFEIVSDKSWEVFDEISIENVGMDIHIDFAGGKTNISKKIHGSLELGDDNKADVYLFMPSGNEDWTFSLAGKTYVGGLLDFKNLLKEDVIGELDIPEGLANKKQLVIEACQVDFHPKRSVSNLMLSVNSELEFDLIPGMITISKPAFDLSIYNPFKKIDRVIDAKIYGHIDLNDFPLDIEAEKNSEGWLFRGETSSDYEADIGNFVKKLASKIGLCFESPDIKGRNLYIEVNLPQKPDNPSDPKRFPSYEFGGTIDWKLYFGSYEVNASAQIALSYDKNKEIGSTPGKKFTGTITGTIPSLFNPSETMEISYDIGEKQIGLNIGTFNLGQILQMFGKFVSGDKNFKFGGLLKSLNNYKLENLALRYDLDDKHIEVECDPNIELPPYVSITKITFIYKKVGGKGKTFCNIEGTIFGQTFTENNPYVFDPEDNQLLKPKPKLLDLRYLGVGQHIGLNVDPWNVDTVEKCLTELRSAAKAITNESEVPLTSLKTLGFSKKSSWLIGADLTLMDTFTLKAIFNDPNMYGLYVRAYGPKAAALQGFEFEILYQKITEDIGRYKAELTLPESIRRIRIKALVITLPTIGVEIYTNSDFKIDLGFPRSIQDFSRSASAEITGGFIGRGGFYFAKLSGPTSRTVPVISNGTFTPVIEFGAGLSVGRGASFKKGPLSARIEIALRVILEGTLAWFKPSDGSSKEMFHKIKGTAALYGIIEGSIDFVIIKASVCIEAWASISMVIESYKKIPVTLEAGVRASVKVKVAFITIKKSFSTTVRKKFTLGSDKPTPWRLSGSGSASPAMAIAQPKSISIINSPMAMCMAAPMPAMAAASDSGDKITAKIHVVPAFGKDSNKVKCTSFLAIENPKSDENENCSFDNLIERFVEDILKTFVADSGCIGLDDLHEIMSELEKIQKGEKETININGKEYTMGINGLEEFFAENVEFEISTDSQNEIEAAYFPMFPQLKMEYGAESATTTVDFAAKTMCDTEYAAMIDDYFAQTQMNVNS